MSWKYSVCGPCGGAHTFPNLNTSLIVCPVIDSPLDRAYSRIVRVNGIVSTLTPASDQEIINLLVVEIVSTTESYFKDILSELIILCPLTQRQANELTVTLASALWGFKALQSRLGFEQNSLASSDNLKRMLGKMKLFQETAQLTILMEMYDQVCELRHVIAHSKGLVTGKNALQLGLSKSNDQLEVALTVQNIQDIANLCLMLCRAFNQELFYITAKRWALNWKTEFPSWNQRIARNHFKKIWKIFYSPSDSIHIQTHNLLDEKRAREAVEREFRVTYS
jgi:hypothetical protein